jgi:DNA-binding winged helix-turn-helix (wHTH) protein
MAFLKNLIAFFKIFAIIILCEGFFFMRETINDAPVLLAQNGPLRGMNWVVDRQLTIGRGDDCDIIIHDRQVSRFHAEIKYSENGDFVIADLNSKNGTMVNGETISKVVSLKDGDEIRIALAQEFLFVSSEATLPIDRVIDSAGTSSKKLFIEKKARRVWIGEQEIIPTLSVSQFDLLVLIYDNERKVVSREEIVRQVWGEEESIGVSEQAIDALVRRLRARLTQIDSTHDYIQTVRGVGFIFENEGYE